MTVRSGEIQRRARYARTNRDLLVTAGLPSGMDPSVWYWANDSVAGYSPLNPSEMLAAVTRATSLITNTLASLPWRHLTGGADPRQSFTELPAPRWLTDPQLLRPDARFGLSIVPAANRMGRTQFWGQWIRSALLRGMGYLIFEEGADGQPWAGSLRILNPDLVSPVFDPVDGYTYRRIQAEHGGGYVDTGFDGRFMLGPRQYRLVELTNPVFQVDEYGVTKGVLESHAVELGLARQATNYASSMYRSGVPSGILKVSVPNYSKPQADALRSQFLASHGGDGRSVAVLNATTDFVPLSFKPIDMDLIRARQMSILDTANMFGIPSFYLGYDPGSSNTYSNAESRNQDLRQSLLHWATAIEDVLGALFPANEWAEIDFRGLLRPDTKTRYESYSLALNDGWLTVDEVRQIENLGSLPEQGYPAADPELDPVKEADDAVDQ